MVKGPVDCESINQVVQALKITETEKTIGPSNTSMELIAASKEV